MTDGNYMTKSEHPELGKRAGSDGLASAMNDNYPILVTTASLTSLREQAAHLREYLADDANVFGAEWLEEQQRRLEAVYSYVKDRAVKAEVSHCQRWIELRIGEWLGPTQQGNRTDLTSLPGNEVKINNRHKHEFRFLAEHKATVTAILQTYPGMEITRADLLAAIEYAVLAREGAKQSSKRKVRGNMRVPVERPLIAPYGIVMYAICIGSWIERGVIIAIKESAPSKNPFTIWRGLTWKTSSLPRRRSGLLPTSANSPLLAQVRYWQG